MPGPGVFLAGEEERKEVVDVMGSQYLYRGVGVVDPGLGAGFGINILSNDEEIRKKAETFIKIAKHFVEQKQKAETRIKLEPLSTKFVESLE